MLSQPVIQATWVFSAPTWCELRERGIEWVRQPYVKSGLLCPTLTMSHVFAI